MKEWKDKVEKTKGVCPGINGICFNKDGNDVGISNLVLDHIFPISKANKEFKLSQKLLTTLADINYPNLLQATNAETDSLLELIKANAEA